MKKVVLIFGCVGVLCLLTIASVLAQGNGPVMLVDKNYELAKETIVAKAQTMSTPDQIEDARKYLSSNILDREEVEQLFASTLTNVKVNEKSGVEQIPEMILHNGDMVIFTKEGDAGWDLESGDLMALKFSLNLDINPGSDENGEKITIGFIQNGKITERKTEKSEKFLCEITADETGIYYPFIVNASAGNIILNADGVISNVP